MEKSPELLLKLVLYNSERGRKSGVGKINGLITKPLRPIISRYLLNTQYILERNLSIIKEVRNSNSQDWDLRLNLFDIEVQIGFSQ